MSLYRVGILTAVLCRGLGRQLFFIFLLFVVGVTVLTLAVGWNGQTVTLFGIPEEGYGELPSREAGMPVVLATYFGAAWAIGLLIYVLPTVLLPLASSYSLTHLLWLRSLHFTPREVAAARVVRVLIALVITTGLAVVWVAVMAVYHEIGVRVLLYAVTGWSAHLLLASGLLLAIGPHLQGTLERATAAMAGILLPIAMFAAAYIGSHRTAETVWGPWVPYTCPLTHLFPDAERHYAAAAVGGVLLLFWSIIAARGRIVRFPSAEHPLEKRP
ncbi:MAG: hypothetical protein EBV06_05590 [Planctomycetia bacterium]|nr:hypothetical protein [Planctomycetia bacterium]